MIPNVMTPYELVLSISLGCSLVAISIVNVRFWRLRRKLDQTFEGLQMWAGIVSETLRQHRDVLEKAEQEKERANA